MLIAADGDADAEVDAAGAALELLPELLHAAAVTASVTPTASAGMTRTAWRMPPRACRWSTGRALDRHLETINFRSPLSGLRFRTGPKTALWSGLSCR
jgi:hypothetical protein